jgi:hypothetical protein
VISGKTEKCLLLFRRKRHLVQGTMPILWLLLSTLSKRPIVKKQGLSRKSGYFRLLLTTFCVGLVSVSF